MGSNNKGWHNESMRHKEAKMYGKASGGKVKAPTAPKDPFKKYNSQKGMKSFSELKKDPAYYNYSETDEVEDAKKESKLKKFDKIKVKLGSSLPERDATYLGKGKSKDTILISYRQEGNPNPIITEMYKKGIVNSNKNKPNVVDIANKKVSVGEAVSYHNTQAKKALKQIDVQAYRYHTREAIKIIQKAMLLKMKGSK